MLLKAKHKVIVTENGLPREVQPGEEFRMSDKEAKRLIDMGAAFAATTEALDDETTSDVELQVGDIIGVDDRQAEVTGFAEDGTPELKFLDEAVVEEDETDEDETDEDETDEDEGFDLGV